VTLAVLIGVFLILMLCRTPIAFALAASVIASLLVANPHLLSVVVSQPIQGVDSFVYLAIPLFIFAGSLMEVAGISKRLVELAESLVGWMPGGLALSVVVATIFFSGISGSKLAEAGAMGATIFPRMAAAEYPPPMSVGVVAAASAMGEMVPPAILMIVLATIANQSVATLFEACLLPALVMSLCLMVQILIKSRHLALPRKPFGLRRLVETFVRAIPALLVPVVVLGGLIAGYMTPTEAGAVAVIMVLAVGAMYRELRFALLPKLLFEAAMTSGAVLFLVAIATILSFILALLNVPQSAVHYFLSVTHSTFAFMLFTIAVLVAFGSALESVPAALIFLPVFLPVIDTLHVPIIQYLVVVVGALGIGLFLPPLGVGSIMLAGLAGIAPRKSAKEITWLLVSVFVALLLIALFPQISLFVPSVLGAHSGA